MSLRNTKTGQVLERTVIPALETAGYAYKRQARIGKKPDGSPYKADLLVADPVTGRRIVVSLNKGQRHVSLAKHPQHKQLGVR